MRRVVHSPAYARAKLATGTLFGTLGLVIVVRTAASGVGLRGFSAYVLGLVLVALALWRFREFYGGFRR